MQPVRELLLLLEGALELLLEVGARDVRQPRLRQLLVARSLGLVKMAQQLWSDRLARARVLGRRHDLELERGEGLGDLARLGLLLREPRVQFRRVRVEALLHRRERAAERVELAERLDIPQLVLRRAHLLALVRGGHLGGLGGAQVLGELAVQRAVRLEPRLALLARGAQLLGELDGERALREAALLRERSRPVETHVKVVVCVVVLVAVHAGGVVVVVRLLLLLILLLHELVSRVGLGRQAVAVAVCVAAVLALSGGGAVRLASWRALRAGGRALASRSPRDARLAHARALLAGRGRTLGRGLLCRPFGRVARRRCVPSPPICPALAGRLRGRRCRRRILLRGGARGRLARSILLGLCARRLRFGGVRARLLRLVRRLELLGRLGGLGRLRLRVSLRRGEGCAGVGRTVSCVLVVGPRRSDSPRKVGGVVTMLPLKLL